MFPFKSPILLLIFLNLWSNVNCQIKLPNYGDSKIKAFLFKLDRNFVTTPFVDFFSKFATGNNLRDTTCSLKIASLGANLRSNQTDLQQESIACTFND